MIFKILIRFIYECLSSKIKYKKCFEKMNYQSYFGTLMPDVLLLLKEITDVI